LCKIINTNFFCGEKGEIKAFSVRDIRLLDPAVCVYTCSLDLIQSLQDFTIFFLWFLRSKWLILWW